MLLVTQKVGGVAVGAFDRGGVLVGFVFGITGVENGKVVHWSDMLAVRPHVRDQGVGRLLKDFQRHTVANIGARVIYWTFDPLVSRNAHLNFNVFGVRAVEYSRDMYGEDTGSALHRGIGTDRLVVAWPVDDTDLERRKQETAAARASSALLDAPVLGDAEREDKAASALIGTARHFRLAIPHDVSIIQASDMKRASRWRQSTRRAFEAVFSAGYSIDGFTSDATAERGYYLLTKGKAT
jgi:predicted GNAT superfamily acetyltransferase